WVLLLCSQGAASHDQSIRPNSRLPNGSHDDARRPHSPTNLFRHEPAASRNSALCLSRLWAAGVLWPSSLFLWRAVLLWTAGPILFWTALLSSSPLVRSRDDVLLNFPFRKPHL